MHYVWGTPDPELRRAVESPRGQDADGNDIIYLDGSTTSNSGTNSSTLDAAPALPKSPLIDGDRLREFMAMANAGCRTSVGNDTALEKTGQKADGYDFPAPGGVDALQPYVSELHASGECKPCLYVNSKSGCFNGADCRFCHLQHSKNRRPRPCKSKRAICKQLVTMLDTAADADPRCIAEASQFLAGHSAYIRTILQCKRNEASKASNALDSNVIAQPSSQCHSAATPSSPPSPMATSNGATSSAAYLQACDDNKRKSKRLQSL
mmetsp:Transcript_120701/g.341320  ORF Transcript_120701/g.341320 Transcript_120701/m.341320 type:complete len:265 (-) Transcript_120701:217-1011(-)|eukprot:CAMPEP_0117514858 /NCGR_PEP_ID=MMETSP0784-20121206/30282_1 /TAXON_ID=39447 /ORGANISM="" /LENGTH=264 /DNA_ID=CAMNT_0005310659 /DNA_START=135 /DNA_END=929 /DNA_ORIENTATION=+